MDDGRTHAVQLSYLASQLTVLLDGHVALHASMELVRKSEPARGTTRPTRAPPPQPTASGSLDRGTLQLAVLDRRGHGFLGFVAGSGAVGVEQYEIHSWSFRRVMTMPTGPPPTEDEVELAEDVAYVAVARAEAQAAQAADAIGGSEYGSAGSWDSGSGEGDSGSAEVDSGSAEVGSGSADSLAPQGR